MYDLTGGLAIVVALLLADVLLRAYRNHQRRASMRRHPSNRKRA